MLDVNLIRTRVLLIAEPGLASEAALRQICAEAERYGAEREGRALEGTLFQAPASKQAEELELVRDLRGILKEMRSAV